MGLKFWALSAVVLAFSGILLQNSRLDSNNIELAPSPPLTGNLAPNNKLEKATYLAKGKIVGPETIEINKDGLIYTGLANGEVVSVDLAGNVKKIAIIGNLKDESICRRDETDPQCGRPMGLKLKGNFLYVADAFYGIVKVDVNTGKKNTILSSKDKRFGDKTPMFTNDLDIDDEGVIYFVDSSYSRGVNEFLEEHIEAHARGRLFSFDPRTEKLDMLLSGLYFPNGITLTPSKDALLINENTMARIIRYHLRGENQGKVDLFAILPGFADTIRLTPKNTLLVPFGVSRHSNFYSLLDLLGSLPILRNVIGTLIPPGTLFKMAPKYGLLVEYDLNGNILNSWHDPSGKVVESTSSAAVYGNKLYIGSFYMDYIAVVDK